MKATKITITILILLLLSGIGLLLQRDFSTPNQRLFTEMMESPAYESQSANPIFKDGKTMQKPVEGTIPRGFQPFHYENTDEDRERAGEELKNTIEPTLTNLERGKEVYVNYCQHCHGARGAGDGAVANIFPGFAYPINGQSTLDMPEGELFHIVTHGRNNMPAHAAQITQDDRWKLIHYLRDLQKVEIARLGDLATQPEDPRRHTIVSARYGKELFGMNCGSCHGPEGKNPQEGTPTLNHPTVLAYADDNFYWDIISHGRKGTQMPAWENIFTPTQIQSLVSYIRTWQAPVANRAEVLTTLGDIKRGRSLFRGHCGGCHGQNGKGGIGNSLNTPSFLALTSDEFLRDTILMGRKHTAMPSAYDFNAGDLADLVAYIKSWKESNHTYKDVEALVPLASPKIGKKVFGARCASCHGKKGEGGIGSRLNSENFLKMVDNKFLYRAIMEGRPGTAMPAWHFLSKEDVADLISFMRTWQVGPLELPPPPKGRGNAEFGKILFNRNCIGCHGPEGRGGVGGQVGNKVFLDSSSDGFLWQSIAHGKDGTAMRGFLQGTPGGALVPLKANDITNLVAYLRELQTKPRLDPLMKPYVNADPENGKIIYDSKASCAKCHGSQGEGASGPSLSNPGFLRVASNGFLAGTIILGREDTEMLSYYRGGNVKLTGSEVQDVVAYIRELGSQKVTKKRYVEATDSSIAEGKILFEKMCASCHGTAGQGAKGSVLGGYAPSINNKEFLDAADDNFLLATIALGRPGTPMTAMAKGGGGIVELMPDEIKKIVAYIRSWEKKWKK